MRWSLVPLLAALFLVPSVTFADEAPSSRPLQLELGGSLGAGGVNSVGVPDGIRAGVLYQPWAHLGFVLEVRHLFMDASEYDKGLRSFDAGTLAVRVSGAIGPVTLFFAPGAGLARGIVRDGDLTLYDRVETTPAFSARAGLELPIAKGFVLGTAGYGVVSGLDGAPEGSVGVDLYGAFRF